MKKIKNQCFLVLAALLWGAAFVAQSKGGEEIGAYTFNCVRSFIGSAFLVPVVFIRDKYSSDSVVPVTGADKKRLLVGGICCGAVLFAATNLQQLGLNYGTPAGKAGFLTACYIVLVPIIGMIFGRKCHLNVWISVGITVVGLYLLCINGSFGVQTSDILVLLCALAFSFHILVIDRFSPLLDGVRLSCVQFFVCGLLSAIPMVVFELLPDPSAWIASFASSDAWIPLLYAGICSCGIAYTLQILGQKETDPTVASLLMSLESVFSVLSGWVILGEKLTAKELCGCLLIFTAVVLAQLPVERLKKR